MVKDLEIWYENVNDAIFAHIKFNDGKPWGKAKRIRDEILPGTWVTIPPSLQPMATWYLTKKCGFEKTGSLPINEEMHDILLKVV